MEPISYETAYQIPAQGSFSFLLAGESHPVKREITMEFFYPTGKPCGIACPVMSFQWCKGEPFADRRYIPTDQMPWVRWDNEMGWLAKAD